MGNEFKGAFVFKVLSIVSIVAVLVGIVFSYQNCGQSKLKSPNEVSDSSGQVNVSGKVEQSNLAGCRFLICDEKNPKKCYFPIHMDTSLLVSGNNVKIEGEIRDDIMTACNAGPVVDVKKAELIAGISGSPSSSPTASPTSSP